MGVQMIQRRRYAVLAGIADILFYAVIAGAIFALIGAFVKYSYRPVHSVYIAGVLIFALIVYHLLISRKVQWLSPGELTAGRFIHQDKKMWLNPYHRNRWALYSLQIITLIVVGSSWYKLFNGHTYPLLLVVGLIAVLSIVMYGVSIIGSGSLRGILPIFFYYLLLAGLVIVGKKFYGILESTWIPLLILFLNLAACIGVAAWFYSKDHEETSSEPEVPSAESRNE
jgi:MFS family permease